MREKQKTSLWSGWQGLINHSNQQYQNRGIESRNLTGSQRLTSHYPKGQYTFWTVRGFGNFPRSSHPACKLQPRVSTD